MSDPIASGPDREVSVRETFGIDVDRLIWVDQTRSDGSAD